MSMLPENLQRNDVGRADLGGFQQNRWGHSILVGLLPARRTDAPVIAGLKTWKTEVRHRRAQIIALGSAVTEKAFRHHTADTVTSKIRHIGSTMSISEPSGHRLAAADLERLTENVQIDRLGCVYGRCFRAHFAMESTRSLPKEWHISRQGG